MRTIILCLVLVGCAHMAPPQNAAPVVATPAPVAAPKPEAKPAPRNFVCERFAYVNDKAVCTPEFTDAGEHHMHSARVAIDQQMISCATNDASPTVVCDDFIVITPRAVPPQPSPALKAKGKK